jgi:ferric-dicitrate binding protein FerR (iron transport regulator)
MLKLPKQIDYHFLVRVLNDEITPEEKEYFESWLSESEKNREVFGEITFLWDKIGSVQSITLPDPLVQWEKIASKVALSNTKTDTKILEKESKIIQIEKFNESFRKRIFSSNIIKAAAVVAVIAVSSLFLFYMDQKIKHDTVQPSEQIKTYEAIARKGEKIELSLSDGSKILVNSDSKLIYPSQFDPKFREVELNGEAYFSVASDSLKPFKVKCGNTITVVKGTEFNIRNRKNIVRVVVAEGSVDTYTPNSNIAYKLKKGDMVFYNNQTGYAEKRKVDLEKHLAWKNGKLIFDRTKLYDVMEEIERCFNVDVKFADAALMQKSLTGVFETNSIDRILSVISLALDIQILHNGRNILIKNIGS